VGSRTETLPPPKGDDCEKGTGTGTGLDRGAGGAKQSTLYAGGWKGETTNNSESGKSRKET